MVFTRGMIQKSGRASDKKKKLVLIIEDEIQYSSLLKESLEKEGIQAQVAADGQAALNFLEKQTPDLIVLDLIMPRMDGRTFLEKAKANQKFGRIKVIVVSNLGEEIKSEFVKEWGVKDYIIKADISLEKIIAKIKKAIG